MSYIAHTGADAWSYDYGDNWHNNNPIIYDGGQGQGSPFDKVDTNIPPPPNIPTGINVNFSVLSHSLCMRFITTFLFIGELR